MYIQLRITPEFCGVPELLKGKTNVVLEICRYLKKYGDIEHIAGSIEKLNKFGEPTALHWHINIVLDDHLSEFKKDSFQAWFRRRPYLPKGNKCYSISIVGDPTDEDRWWRYLLKENDNPFVTNFPEEFKQDFEKHVAMAQDERKIQIERNIAARDRALQNDSFRLKCYNAVDEQLRHNYSLHSNPTDPEFPFNPLPSIIMREIIKYYQANNKVPPFNTLKNMVSDYRVTFGYLDIQEYCNSQYPDELTST